MVDQQKLVEMTRSAENGDNDKVAQAFAQLPFEDHLSYGRAMVEQSQKDHAANANLPTVELTEVNVPNYGQKVDKIEAVGTRSFMHPTSWLSGEWRSVLYTEPKPSAISVAISETLSTVHDKVDKLNPLKWAADALDKSVHSSDQK